MKKINNTNGLLLPLIVSILLVGMFFSFLRSFDKRNAVVNDNIKNERAIVLSADCDEKVLSEIIFNNGYAESKDDADFIASILAKRQKEYGKLPSLYTLQKRLFGQVPALLADSCGKLSTKLDYSCNKLGQNDKVFPFVKDSLRPDCNGKIVASVFDKVESPNKLKKLLKIEDKVPCPGVQVRLVTHFRDSLGQACDPVIVGYLPTDSIGLAVFDGLDTEASYSVLPIKRGFEYGTSKGTKEGKWGMDDSNNSMLFSFEEKEHRIPLFGNATLKQIKADRTILMRTPKDYKAIVVKWFVFSLLAWWVLCLMRIRKKQKNGWLLASGMFLTVLCVLMMFSMQDPLNDELHGVTMGQGVVIGLVVCIALQNVDMVKFYQNKYMVGFDVPLNLLRWLFKPYRKKVAGLAAILKSNAGVFKKMITVLLVMISLPLLILDLLQITRLSNAIERLCEKLPKGIGWLVLALVLTALLWTPLGQSIGGMKVNLNLLGIKFQPSEIAKYLMLLFMAAFFTQQADSIVAYSQPHRMNMIGRKLKTLIWIIIGLIVLMAMYLKLGDMGPGLVIGITFIILYSLIKSKVHLDNLKEEDRWKRIFTCDFAMMIYGVLSFVAFLIGGYLIGNMLLFGSLWFVFWICLGYFGYKKQLFESAVMMSLVIFMFVFGGDFLSLIDKDAGERFEGRVSMCSNTWGTIDLEHINPDLTTSADPVSNTQVAEGLWALASGGLRGQGWGGGKPSLVPAFHTDMILSSIGEQLGWYGLLLVVLALAVLLRKMIIVGYRVGHPFAFFLCLGFAIVIGVQFFIIALGSTGMIPLTGVTVPFLSFGRVSMILNLAALGIVLSLSNNISEEKTAVVENASQKTVKQYSYPIAIVTMVFMVFALTTLFVWQYYQFWKRNSTLIHPVYVLNNDGTPNIKYNPRIDLLLRNMYAGRIYDRNGILLATSDKSEINTEAYVSMGIDRQALNNMLKRNQIRYYPMGEHLFFMVGDRNEGIMFAYNENHPAGYMAEAQHLSYLRDFDNIMYDKSGDPIKIKLKTDRLMDNPYLSPKESVSDPILLKNYSELLKYLKDGIDGKKIEQHNNRVKKEKYDLHLTVDAALQIDLQNSIANYMQERHKSNSHYNLMRVSTVVLDAENGDLLASANYPLPDFNRLKKEEDLAKAKGKRYAVYSDNEKGKNWLAYTDRDLGTTFQTAPGSTAKVMSAMAGFRKLGTEAASVTYRITNENAIEISSKTGWPLEPTIDNPNSIHRHNPVTMKHAIVESSNCYFVNLVNDKDLYNELKVVYNASGINVGGISSYFYSVKSDTVWKKSYYDKIDANRNVALHKFDLFKEGKLNDPKDRQVKEMIHTNMSVPEWKWAWGQGYSNDSNESFDLLASPLNMARIASAVVNDGKMPETQYLLSSNKYEKELRNENSIKLLRSKEAKILKEFMLAEAANQFSRQGGAVSLPSYVGGKTGTPERSRVLKSRRVYSQKDKKYITKYDLENKGKTNDGWYMFFVEGDATHHHIAVAVRMERLDVGSGSGAAVRLTDKVLLDCLNRHGYIKNN